jgi:hypothetical protein
MELQRLEKENIELKRVLAVLMNKSLIKDISESLGRVRKGEYLSEEEFFKNSPQ